MGSFLQGVAGGIQQIQENRLQKAQLEHLTAQTEHMKAQADQVKQFHTLLKTMTQPEPGKELEGPGAPIPAFKPGELNPDAHTPDVMDMGEAMQQEGPRPMSAPGPAPIDAVLSGYSPQARSFISAALQSGDPNTVSAIMARVMNQPETKYIQFDPERPTYAHTPGQAPELFAPGSPKQQHVIIGPGQVAVDPTTGKQIFAGPPKEETPKSPLTVSDENRFAGEIFNTDYVKLDPQQKGVINKRIQEERKEIAREQATGRALAPEKASDAMRKEIAEQQTSFSRFSEINTKFLEAGEQVKDWLGPTAGRWGKIKENFGGFAGIPELPAKQAEFYTSIAAFDNKVINLLSGANVPPAEFDRIVGELPRMEQPPATFQARLTQTEKNLRERYGLFKDILGQTGVNTTGIKNLPAPTPKAITKPDEAKAYLEEQKKKLRQTMQGGAHAAQP